MRVCAHCRYENADVLAYCFQCGRRLGAPAASPTAAFAATVALPSARLRQQIGDSDAAPPPPPAGVARRAVGALTYVFAYVRGRIHAEDRKRTLSEERRGAEGLIEATLAELGATVIASPAPAPELADAIQAVAAARKRRETAAVDLASAEKLQATEDLRLGLAQATAESEWQACVRGAEDMDRMLRQLEGERRTEEASDLRERASALRASTTKARAKLDQATAARRTAAVAMAAGFAAQTRARAEAERAVAERTMDAGRRALELRLPGSEFTARYERIERLRKTIADADSTVAHLDKHIGGYHNRRLAAGVGVLGALIAVVAAGLWALLR